MNNDTLSGKFDQMKGKVKQSVGEATGDDRMANSGTADQVKGAAKESWGSMKDAVNTPPTTTGDLDTRGDAGDVRNDSSRTPHDVREKVVSTAQNVKESIKRESEDARYRRSA